MLTGSRNPVCTCRGYDPADPCGHGDTSEGCPRHDPNYEPDELDDERNIISLATSLDQIEQSWKALPPIKPGLYFYMAKILIESGAVQ